MATDKERRIKRDQLIEDANDKLDKIMDLMDDLADRANISTRIGKKSQEVKEEE